MPPPAATAQRRRAVRLFLCGDVMLGRGIDQILEHPCEPQLAEAYAQSALEYVHLAEQTNGPIPRGAGPSYLWGVALHELERMRPDARIINLETAVTRSDDHAPKGINYRVSPENAECLTAASIDCCVLSNNHVLDWGRAGLLDTLTTLEHLKIKTAGAGLNRRQSVAPAVLDIAGGGRALVFSFGAVTSGIPHNWAATENSAGINVLTELSEVEALQAVDRIKSIKRPSDLAVISIHWGPNWGYEITEEQRNFAHMLVDRADVSIVHGHSSHHAKAIEIYRKRLILYGCGDFLNDYEGIRGYDAYRDDLALMYFADIDPATTDLVALRLVPLQIKNFRLVRPSPQDIDWLRDTLDRESLRFGIRVALDPAGALVVSVPPAMPPQTSGVLG